MTCVNSLDDTKIRLFLIHIRKYTGENLEYSMNLEKPQILLRNLNSNQKATYMHMLDILVQVFKEFRITYHSFMLYGTVHRNNQILFV